MGTHDNHLEARESEHDHPRDAFASALLRNPTRRRIMRLLTEKPGMNKHQLAQALGINANTVKFHIERLEQIDQVETRAGTGRETLCFTTHNIKLWDDRSTRVLFGRGPPRDVAMYLADHPGAGADEVSKALDLSLHTVRRHIRTLEEGELVQRIRVDRKVIYQAGPNLRKWIELTNCPREYSSELRQARW